MGFVSKVAVQLLNSTEMMVTSQQKPVKKQGEEASYWLWLWRKENG